MKVIHIIPSAFNYFDDIRADAFRLVDELDRLGVENEVVTLQYSATEPEDELEETSDIRKSGQTQRIIRKHELAKRTFEGIAPLQKIIDSLAQFDIIHVHCPLFGAAGKIVRWKRDYPEKFLIITYYRRVRTPDFFSLLLVAYNLFYLPKLFSVASVVASADISKIPAFLAKKSNRLVEINSDVKFYDIDLTCGEDGRELSDDERLAIKYAMVYNNLLN